MGDSGAANVHRVLTLVDVVLQPSAEVDQSAASAPLVDGFPKLIEAAVLWADQDNMNTDGCVWSLLEPTRN